MGGKYQSIMVSFLSAVAAVFLAAAAFYEYSRGETGMAVLIVIAVACAIALSWYTRKPYEPRIRFQPRTSAAQGSRQRRTVNYRRQK